MRPRPWAPGGSMASVPAFSAGRWSALWATFPSGTLTSSWRRTGTTYISPRRTRPCPLPPLPTSPAQREGGRARPQRVAARATGGPRRPPRGGWRACRGGPGRQAWATGRTGTRTGPTERGCRSTSWTRGWTPLSPSSWPPTARRGAPTSPTSPPTSSRSTRARPPPTARGTARTSPGPWAGAATESPRLQPSTACACSTARARGRCRILRWRSTGSWSLPSAPQWSPCPSAAATRRPSTRPWAPCMPRGSRWSLPQATTTRTPASGPPPPHPAPSPWAQ
mmetsp:Transcript_10517/g.34012  ORF Transcript_10517/g.34012 Transcript_10517/m.34012 type:complete len:280 (-) Transcript_10517:1817-2656(-)